MPAFAKIGNLPGGLTTMFVNWFAVLGVSLIIIFSGRTKLFKRPQPYKKLILAGLIWPFLYSILYFSSINKGSASLTTIVNYTWPIFYFIFASILVGKRINQRNWVVILIGTAAVAFPIIMEGNIKLILLPLSLALIAAITQSVYSLITEKFKEDDWLITFVVELVTAIGSTFYVLIFEQMFLPNLKTLGYMAFIGIFSNGIGFWAFLKASQKSALNTYHKTSFLILMCLIPLIQVILLPLLGAEVINPAKVVGVILITYTFILHRLTPRPKNSGKF